MFFQSLAHTASFLYLAVSTVSRHVDVFRALSAIAYVCMPLPLRTVLRHHIIDFRNDRCDFFRCFQFAVAEVKGCPVSLSHVC